jgi:monovalent cation:H+ antiporter, CPA1 family
MHPMSVLYASTRVDVTLTVVVALLLVASLVAIAAFYLRLPYTVALVVAGLAFSVSGAFGNVALSKPIILLVFVPPLVFDGAINMHLVELRRRWKQVGMLALPGTIVTAAVIAVALMIVPHMSASAATLIAVILAPTDPVSVLAIFKTNGVAAGLQTLLEGESIFNDALGIALYVVAVDVAFPRGKAVSVLGGIGTFAVEILVGVAVGIAVGFVAKKLMDSLDDHLVEITLSLVAAYGSFLVADRLHGSGIIATMAAGLFIGNYGAAQSRAESRVALVAFWEVIAFLANSAVFLLIGLAFHIRDLFERRTVVAAVVAVVAMFAARAVVTWGLLPSVIGGRDRHSETVALGAVLGRVARWHSDRACARARGAPCGEHEHRSPRFCGGAVLADRSGHYIQAVAQPSAAVGSMSSMRLPNGSHTYTR